MHVNANAGIFVFERGRFDRGRLKAKYTIEEIEIASTSRDHKF